MGIIETFNQTAEIWRNESLGANGFRPPGALA